ncbi:hypothetical protein EV401DRAFT_2073038 [Pisolithus croceorrhizus]|nr:hypothetical protein EV401DRAFT_2073038 [Pisolithus croceorrhizus]
MTMLSALSKHINSPAQSPPTQLMPPITTASDDPHPSQSSASVLSASFAATRLTLTPGQNPHQVFALLPHPHTLPQNTGSTVQPILMPVPNHYNPPQLVQGQYNYYAQPQIPNAALMGHHEPSAYHILHHAMNSPPPPLTYDNNHNWGQMMLRTYTKDLCSTLEIPKKSLLNFIETGDLFHMLSTMLQETLTSKDFEISLHNRLLACLLSPNITAYVMDTQRHIMDFIFKHQNIFKIPVGVFDNSELKSSLHTVVSRLLATIHSHLKSQLMLSITKKTCIINVTKSLAHMSSGMELEAAHWNRMAFLLILQCCCLHIFLIGTGNLKNIPLNICFMPCLFLMLKPDMQRKVEQELGTDFQHMIPTGEDTSASDNAPELTCANEAHLEVNVTDGTTNPSLMEGEGSINDADVDAKGIPNIRDTDDELSAGDSRFRLEGKPVHFNSGRFWNYVNYMPTLLHKTARKDTSMKEEFEKGVAR